MVLGVRFVVVCQNQMNGQYKFKGFALIVDSIWFYPILGVAGLAILYWFN